MQGAGVRVVKMGDVKIVSEKIIRNGRIEAVPEIPNTRESIKVDLGKISVTGGGKIIGARATGKGMNTLTKVREYIFGLGGLVPEPESVDEVISLTYLNAPLSREQEKYIRLIVGYRLRATGLLLPLNFPTLQTEVA